MDGGLFDLEKYEQAILVRKKNGNLSFQGLQGNCFIEGNDVVKIYNIPNMNVSFLCGYSSKRISFPYYYIEKNGDIYGEIMPYFDAKALLYSLTKESTIDYLIKHYRIICEEIYKFPEIFMIDLSYPNILYDEKKGFYIVDTTSCFLDFKDDFSKVNIESLNRAIIFALGCIIFEYENKLEFIAEKEYFKEIIEVYFQKIKCFSIGKEFLKLIELCLNEEEYRFLDLVDVYCEIVKIYYNDELKTIEDAKKYIKIMKNG
jgi:hypothetical protein